MSTKKKNPPAGAPTWRNRVTHYGQADPRDFLANPKNWRIHPESQQAALAAVLDRVGWVQAAAIVNEHTGFVVDGHLRVALAISRGEASIPVCYVDLTVEEEDLILASLDSIGGAALTDAEKLNSLLGGMGQIDASLASLFGDLLEEGQKTTLLDVAPSEPGEPGSSGRDLGDTAAQIKPVLYATQVGIFEQAIRAAHDPNRGKALIQICEFFLAHSGLEAPIET
ncbi:MAG: hypothetical protein ABI806_24775 [Candidatus Solibacter sp.]